MSLINEALKKAQKQRTGEGPALSALPGVGGEPAAHIARQAKSSGLSPLLLRGGLGAAVLLVVVAGGIVLGRTLLNRPASAPAATSLPPPAAVTLPEPVRVPPPSKPDATVAPTSSAAPFVLPLAAPVTSPAQVAPPPKSERVPPAVVPTTTVATPPPATSVAGATVASRPAGTPAKMNSTAINYIEALRVAGIRASTSDSKVLMNDRVYRAGAIIEHDLGIKLVEITANSLSFEDENGARYTRNF